MSVERQAAVAIVQRLRDAGHEAYLAGGCVRDELLGLDPKDYDVATDAVPEDVRRLFARVEEVGAAFGVMLVREGRVVVEVATFREEGVYSDRRRPDSVSYSTSKRDALRRDFTINALFLDPLRTDGHERGRVIDHVGGVADLESRTLRAVGDPELRLAEDHLRALRGVRLAARLGFTIEDRTAEAIRLHASELAGVSRERIGEELRRMLGHGSRAEAVRLLESLGLDGPALSDRCIETSRETVAALEESSGFALALAAWAIDRLAARLGRRAGAEDVEREAGLLVDRLRAALCLSNLETESLRVLLGRRSRTEREWMEGLSVAGRKRAAGAVAFADELSLTRARRPEIAAAVARDVERLAGDGIGVSPAPLVTGDDLIGAGLRPGPRFRPALEAAYDAQLEGRVRTREEALEVARVLTKDEQGG